MPDKNKAKKARTREATSLSSEDGGASQHVDDAILDDIFKKLKKLDVLDQINGRLEKIENSVSDIEKSLNSLTEDVEKIKMDLDLKADKTRVAALEDEIEELRNRSRRNNLVFYNIPEKAEGADCISFIQNFISQHMGLETLCGQVELERTHRTPTRISVSSSSRKRPRPIHVAFLRYTDKMKVLSNAALRLKDNPFVGNIIGISEDFAVRTQAQRKELLPYKKFLKKKFGVDGKVYIAYPATLKYVDVNGRHKTVRSKELADLSEEMELAKYKHGEANGAVPSD